MNVNPLKVISSYLVAILNVSLLLVSFQNCSSSLPTALAREVATSGSNVSITPSPLQTAEEYSPPAYKQQ